MHTHIMRFQISMQNSVCMTMAHPTQNLPHEAPHHWPRQTLSLPNIIAPLPLIHKSLEIMIHIFKNQVQPPWIGLNHIQKLHHVGVRDFAKKRNFTNNIARDASFGSAVRVGNAFDGDGAAAGALGSTIDLSVSSLTD